MSSVSRTRRRGGSHTCRSALVPGRLSPTKNRTPFLASADWNTGQPASHSSSGWANTPTQVVAGRLILSSSAVRTSAYILGEGAQVIEMPLALFGGIQDLLDERPHRPRVTEIEHRDA